MNLRPVLLMLERLKEWVMLDIYGRHWRCFYKGTGLCPYPCGCRLVLFVALVILTTVTLSHLNVEELGSDFIRSAPLRVGTRNFVSVLGAILPAILISVVAARVAISRYACVAVIVCKNAGRRC